MIRSKWETKPNKAGRVRAGSRSGEEEEERERQEENEREIGREIGGWKKRVEREEDYGLWM